MWMFIDDNIYIYIHVWGLYSNKNRRRLSYGYASVMYKYA